mgnify:CR=1 FL=1
MASAGPENRPVALVVAAPGLAGRAPCPGAVGTREAGLIAEAEFLGDQAEGKAGIGDIAFGVDPADFVAQVPEGAIL